MPIGASRRSLSTRWPARGRPASTRFCSLSRDRLKELCRAFGLDDSGRKKADLAARLVGPIAASKSAGGVGPPAASRPVADTSDPSADTLSVAQLEQYLWSAADILRGSIDSSDYKTYIFSLLFLKRLSDRFEEEAEKLIAEGVSETVAWTDPDEHQFFVRRPEPRQRARASGSTFLPGLAPQRPYDRTRSSRPRLRVPDRAVRRRCGQEGGRVLHAADGRQAHRRAAGADRTDAHLRPDRRLRRHADRVRPLHRAARWQSAQPDSPRPGEETRHLGHLQDEHAAPRAARRSDRRAIRFGTRS